MENNDLNENVEESTEELTEESIEESTEESSEESTEELTEESTDVSAEISIDYDRINEIVADNSYVPSGYDTELNDLPITDVLLLVVALVLGVLCIKGRK